MKLLLIFAILAAVNAASWKFIKDINKYDVDNLIMDSIKKYTEEWRSHGPNRIADFSSCHFQNPDLQLDVNLKNISEMLGSGVAFMETSEVADRKFYAYVQIIQKKFKLEGLISLNGTLKGKNIKKSGQFKGIYDEIRQDISVAGFHNISSTFINEIEVNNTFGNVDIKSDLNFEFEFNKLLAECVRKNMFSLDRKIIRNIPKIKNEINDKINNLNLYDSFILLKNGVPHKVFAPIILFNL